MTISGDGVHAGENCLLNYQNEHLIARIDGRVVATAPDLITMVDRGGGKPISNPYFEKGQDVVVLGFCADPIWRTPAGRRVFEPRYWGYDIDYVPIEELHGK